jgi:hypothetical protein
MPIIKLTSILIFFMIFISGCSTTSDKYNNILVPIATKGSKIDIPPLPYLPIQSLDNKSASGQVIKAYVATVKLLLNDNINLRQAVNAYQD